MNTQHSPKAEIDVERLDDILLTFGASLKTELSN